MTTPDKSNIEKEIIHEIRLRLLDRKLSMKWLAHMLEMDYGKVKRILSERCEQQLSLSVADRMLVLLDSNLREVMSHPIKRTLKVDLELLLNKYSPHI